MHVLLLLEYPTLNGGENSLLSLLPELQKAGVRFSAAAPAGPVAKALQLTGVDLVPMNRSVDASQADRREQLFRLIRQVHPGLVHANSLSMSRLAGPVCQELNLPSVGHLRDMMRLSNTAIGDLARHTRLLSVSKATRRWYVEMGVPAERLFVAYNGVDTERFRPRPKTGYLERELQLAPSTPLIGSVGQIGMRKGLDLLLRAGTDLIRRHPHAHILLVGERNSQKAEAVAYEQNLHQRARKDLPGKVHFLGRRDDIPQILSELTLLVHCAHQEPLGRVLLEAGASGCCILATNVGGTVEIFPPDSGAAHLIQPDDQDATFRGIDVLLCDAERRGKMATAACRRVQHAFRTSDAAAVLLNHYDAILGN